MNKWKITLIGFSITGIIFTSLYFANTIYVSMRKSDFVVGIDVSHHQGEIAWETINKTKIKFAFVKATEGDDYVDSSFFNNLSRAKQEGFLVGAYHFFHFKYSGADQARNFIETVGTKIDLPPVIDFENMGNTKKYNPDTIILELREMIRILEDYYGVRPIVYTTRDYKDILRSVGLFRNVWYRNVFFPPIIQLKNLDFWQYSNRAIINGISSRVDLNVFIGDESELAAYRKGLY